MSYVDVVLGSGESTTVPTGENWVVATSHDTSLNGMTVNGNTIIDIELRDDNSGDNLGDNKVVLTGGDTVSEVSHLGGRTVDASKNPFNEYIAAGNSTTVPTDEVWIVWICMPDGYLSIDGNRIYTTEGPTSDNLDKRGGTTGATKMVFTQGQTISPSGSAVFISGFKRTISSSSLKPRTMTLVSGEYASGGGETIPSDETWRVWITGYSDGGLASVRLRADETKMFEADDSSSTGFIGSTGSHPTILDGPRTMRTGEFGNSGNAYISGFEVSNL